MYSNVFFSYALQMYNKALIIHNDARASDSLAFIREELKRWGEHQIPDEIDKKLKSFFESSNIIHIKQ